MTKHERNIRRAIRVNLTGICAGLIVQKLRNEL
jgi:hypothetical protein